MERGQATLEVLISSGMIALLLVSGGWLIRASWEKGRCVRVVFERTHSVLVGRTGIESGVGTQEDPDSVIGVRACGSTPEKVGFRKLEGLKSWN